MAPTTTATDVEIESPSLAETFLPPLSSSSSSSQPPSPPSSLSNLFYLLLQNVKTTATVAAWNLLEILKLRVDTGALLARYKSYFYYFTFLAIVVSVTLTIKAAYVYDQAEKYMVVAAANVTQKLGASKSQTRDFVDRFGHRYYIDDGQASYHSIQSGRLFMSEQNSQSSMRQGQYSTNKLPLRKIPIPIDINKSDVLVSLHIPYSGGPRFEAQLTQNLNVQPPCNCSVKRDGAKTPFQRLKCKCLNENGDLWLHNRFTVPRPCGSDFTSLTACLRSWYKQRLGDRAFEKRFHLMTILRDPVDRVLSEWMLSKRGVRVQGRLQCGGKPVTSEDVPKCFQATGWKNATLAQFLSCRSNLALNRQTRYLANLSRSDCYKAKSTISQLDRENIMLESAKFNLANHFEYFGLLEYKNESAKLFDATFNGISLLKKNEISSPFLNNMPKFRVFKRSQKIMTVLMDKNRLDIELYKFAKKLFMRRLEILGIPVTTVHTEDIMDMND